MEYNVRMYLNSELNDLEQLSLHIYINKPHLVCFLGGWGAGHRIKNIYLCGGNTHL